MQSSLLQELALLGYPSPISGGDLTPEEVEAARVAAEEEVAAAEQRKKITFSEEQQKVFDREVAKAKATATEKTRTDLLAEIAAQKVKDAEEAQRKKDADAGEFAKVQTSLEKKVSDAEASLGTITSERDQLLTLVKADVAATWKDIPAEVKETYQGGDEDVLAKKQHMVTNAKIIALLQDKTKVHGNSRNPKAGTGATDIDEEVAKARPRYRT